MVLALMGLLKIFEISSGLDIGIDRLLFPDKLGAVGDQPPNRMAPNTALNLLLVGLYLLLLDIRIRRNLWPAQLLALIAFLASLLASVDEHGDSEPARQAGIEAYLTKPVRQPELYDSLTTVMSKPAEEKGSTRKREVPSIPIAAPRRKKPTSTPASS